MLANDQTPPPKAVNIIRPSSAFFNYLKHPASPHLSSLSLHDASQSSSSSSLSTLSSASSSARATPSILSASGFSFLNHSPPSWPSSTPPSSAAFVTNPFSLQHKLLHRPKSNSSLSRSVLSVLDDDAYTEDDGQDLAAAKDDDDESDMDSIDDTTEDEESDDNEVTKVVARLKHGTIMNGKGEFINKGENDDHAVRLDEARANRKIADLEIEKSSLLAVNDTLEATLRRQTAQITELQKQLRAYESLPPTPVSEKCIMPPEMERVPSTADNDHDDLDHDQIFERLRSMVQHLIEQAEAALLSTSKVSGRVLTDYASSLREQEEEVKQLAIGAGRPWSPGHGSANTTIVNRQHQRPLRRVSDGQDHKPLHPRPQSPFTMRPAAESKRTAMQRSLSRASSPPVLITTATRSPSPRPSSHLSPRRATSQLRKSQEVVTQPKWQY